jgi:hypothetical protein
MAFQQIDLIYNFAARESIRGECGPWSGNPDLVEVSFQVENP